MKLQSLNCSDAPKALGNYSHAVICGDKIYLSGMGPRHPKTNEVPGLSLDSDGNRRDYDAALEAQATLENMKCILKAAGSDLDHVIEINVFLTDMEDFNSVNEVYNQYFTHHQPVRTTLGVVSLPGKISVEMKAIAVKK